MADRGEGWWPEEKKPPPAGDRSGEGEGREGDPSRPVPPPARPPRPPRGLQSRDAPKRASRYSMFVGLAFVVIAMVAVLNAVSSDEGGILGTSSGAGAGLPLAEFAAPDVLSGLGGDANIAQDDCESSRNPCPEDQVRVPACDVELAGALRVCDFFDKPLVLSFWFTRGGNCLPTQDALERVAGRRGGELNFLSVNVLDDRSDVERIVRERGWEIPVAYDADGAVSNIYGVGICPTLLFAYPGGILHTAEIASGNFTEDEIDALADDLLEASADRRPRSGA